MTSLQWRKGFVILWLAIAILSAGYAASLGDAQAGGVRDGSLPRWLEFLVETEAAHIITHLTLFMVVGLTLGEWGGGSRQLAWRYVIRGAILMEMVQVIMGAPHPSLPALIGGVAWDFFLDGVGGWLGLQTIDRKRAEDRAHAG
jgi:hypothetical protein